METQLISLSIILLVTFLAPLLASLIPGKPVPEVVFFVFAGAILGPNMLGWVQTDGEALEMLSELGLGFLFLMAGFEIEPRELVNKTGAYASLAWLVSIVIGLAFARFVLPSEGFSGIGGLAFAIALTTTAYGTLAPIMRERGLTGTPVGNAITAYGATGEVLPVLAMAFLLSARSLGATAIILMVFVAVCLVLGFLPRAARKAGTYIYRFIKDSAGSSSHILLRLTVLLLVFLIALSAAFDLDVVLGAFAAGFILRSVFPDGNEDLEESIEGIGQGFLIPVFFVISGAGIDLSAAFANPGMLCGFIGLLIAVRGGVVAVSLRLNSQTRSFTWRETFSTAAYCTMALPLIVAVTSVAVNADAMSGEVASVLVTSGALTVLIIPIVTSLVRVTSDVHPVAAVHELSRGEATLAQVSRRQRREYLEARRRYLDLRRQMRDQGVQLSAAAFLARRNEQLVGHGNGAAVGPLASGAVGPAGKGAAGSDDEGATGPLASHAAESADKKNPVDSPNRD